jgi:hypothetical protein
MEESPTLVHIWHVDPANEAVAVQHLAKMFGGLAADPGFVSAKVLETVNHRQATHAVHGRGLCRDHGCQPGGVLPHHPARDPADGAAAQWTRRQRVDLNRRPRGQRPTLGITRPHQGWTGRGQPVAGDRVRHTRVRVNAVSLGVIRTPSHDPASYAALGPLHPLGRVGEVSDVVDAFLYLKRATFVTGETLHVDGGQAAGGQPDTLSGNVRRKSHVMSRDTRPRGRITTSGIVMRPPCVVSASCGSIAPAGLTGRMNH